MRVAQTALALQPHPCTWPPQHLAPLFALGMTVGSLVLGGAIRVVPFVLFGTYFGWAFLRFVQTRNGVRCAGRAAAAAGPDAGVPSPPFPDACVNPANLSPMQC